MKPTTVLVHGAFAESASWEEAARMAATQRPGTQEGLFAPSGEQPRWPRVPSWFLVGQEGHIIPAELQRFMAERAGARRTLQIPGASHAALVSQPQITPELILEATALPAAA